MHGHVAPVTQKREVRDKFHIILVMTTTENEIEERKKKDLNDFFLIYLDLRAATLCTKRIYKNKTFRLEFDSKLKRFQSMEF